jgi:hypothetical protein
MAGGESLLRKHATAALPVGPLVEIQWNAPGCKAASLGL